MSRYGSFFEEIAMTFILSIMNHIFILFSHFSYYDGNLVIRLYAVCRRGCFWIYSHGPFLDTGPLNNRVAYSGRGRSDTTGLVCEKQCRNYTRGALRERRDRQEGIRREDAGSEKDPQNLVTIHQICSIYERYMSGCSAHFG